MYRWVLRQLLHTEHEFEANGVTFFLMKAFASAITGGSHLLLKFLIQFWVLVKDTHDCTH